MCEDAKRYEPGHQYSEYVRNLPIPTSQTKSFFQFESYTADGIPYFTQPGISSTTSSFLLQLAIAHIERLVGFSAVTKCFL